ncbi:hypothetical protein NDU88_006428 [Pleurodeles waltl]|uniref:Uncharacterized protein n=1 Tax=Pleurodeles waltl TaxID=8319 RepID=A0AAV7LQP4_PLEWA|nr:hypothetical protein NDU88_006428 [Pleurodeles waltl]
MSKRAPLSGALVEGPPTSLVWFRQRSVLAVRLLRDAVLVPHPLCSAVGPLRWWFGSGADIFVVALLEHRCSPST